MQKKPLKKKRTTTSKSKQRAKRLKTFNESDFQLFQQKKGYQLSDIFKNQALKKKSNQNTSQINFNSTINNYTSVYTIVSDSKPQKVKSIKTIKNPTLINMTKKKVNKSKSKSKLIPKQTQKAKPIKVDSPQLNNQLIGSNKIKRKKDKVEAYEIIPMSKSSLNSQIVFSINQTKRESQMLKNCQNQNFMKNNLINDEYLNSQIQSKNELLRQSIKHQYLRKTCAAIQIQKVFRGYLTRKILQKYVSQQQEKLVQLLNKRSSKPHSHRSNRSDFFSSPCTPQTFMDEESINLEKVNPTCFRLTDEDHKQRIVNCQKDVYDQDDEDQNLSNNQSQNQNQSDQINQDQSSSDDDIAVYRRQQPIYSQSQIQKFLASSSSSSDLQYNQRQDKFAHFTNNIIFETNEEHIQSRKSSILQNEPHNKLSKGRNIPIQINQTISSLIKNDQYIRKQVQHQKQQMLNNEKDLDLIKTSKVVPITQHSRSVKQSIQLVKSHQSSITPQQSIKNSYRQELSNQKTSKKQFLKSTIKPNNNKRALNIKIISSQESENDHQAKKDFKPINNYLNQNKDFKSINNYLNQDKDKYSYQQNDKNSQQKNFNKKNRRIYYFQDQQQQSDALNNSQNNNRTQNNNMSQKNNSSQRNQQQIKINRHKRHLSENSSKSKQRKNEQFQRLKKIQIKRWDQIIELINNQSTKDIQLQNISNFNKTTTINHNKNQQFEGFIKQIMQLSVKNKQLLASINKKSQDKQEKSSDKQEKSSDKQEYIRQNYGSYSQHTQEQQYKWQQLKQILSSSHRNSIRQQQISICRPHHHMSKNHPSQFMTQSNLKQKLHPSNEFILSSFQSCQIQTMLSFRQELLQKRQCQELAKLNQCLIRKQITQKQFLGQLTMMTTNFHQEKSAIDKARDDINNGYHAAIKLIRQSIKDGRKIGYKLPLSRSTESYKTNKLLSTLGGYDSIIIDQLNSIEFDKRSQNQKSKLTLLSDKRKQQQQNKQQKQQENQKQSSEQKEVQQFLKIQKPSSPLSILSQYYQTPQPAQVFSPSHAYNPIEQNQSLTSFRTFKDKFFNQEDNQYSPYINDIFQEKNHEKDIKQDQEQEDSVEFTKEEMRRFTKAQPYDMEIALMNRNLIIGSDFIKMQQSQSQPHIPLNYHLNLPQSTQSTFSRSIKLHRQIYQIQQQQSPQISTIYTNQCNLEVDLITEKEIDWLVVEVCVQLIMKPLFAEKFLYRKRQQMFALKKIDNQVRMDFINIVKVLIPKQNTLQQRINQNISPLPKQLLKCMRIDFSQDDQSQQNNQQYQQIGKYQMILDQQVCNTAIQQYKQILEQKKQSQIQMNKLTTISLEQTLQQYEHLDQKSIQFMLQRQRFVLNRKQHCQGIKWQFINMELHSIFDAWNQQIIQLKTNKNGFSGIGLNQLTLSMKDRNLTVKQHHVNLFIRDSRYRLMAMLGYHQQITQQIQQTKQPSKLSSSQNINNYSKISKDSNSNSLKTEINNSNISKSVKNNSIWLKKDDEFQEYSQIRQDSKWVYYADQALSYGLQLVYLIEQQIFNQIAQQLRKKTLQMRMIL